MRATRMAKTAGKGEARPRLRKVPTGISGFDGLTAGGLPAGRPTLVCGSAGCGKSLFAAEFLVRGATRYGEPGVLMTFEESTEDVVKNVASLGFDVNRLIAQKKMVVDHVRLERAEIVENGEYDLEGLFIRLGYAVDRIGAKRVALDTLEALFGGLTNQAVLRSELRRLFGWLKDRGLTTVVTGERGEGQLTRQGLEEYVSDCVVLLDHRVTSQVSTRRLRVVKYRGSTHGTNEYPFVIDEAGISVLPITTAALDYRVSDRQVSVGITQLDEMLGGGLYEGSTVLLSGTAGTGKTTVAVHAADAACRRGERALYFTFEESQAQMVRNMRSIGLSLGRHLSSGLLQVHATRPTVLGLEMHLVRMHSAVEAFAPSLVIVDPVSSLQAAGTVEDSTHLVIRLIDILRQKGVTILLVSLTPPKGTGFEATDEGTSSLVDSWIVLRGVESGGERSRTVHVLKSRGMAHSNQVREFVISPRGVRLMPVYLGASGVLTGSARLAEEARDRAAAASAAAEVQRRTLAFSRRRKSVQAQIAALRADLEADREEHERILTEARSREQQAGLDREALSRSRRAGTAKKPEAR